jgi:anti-sigma B factor antagonist
VDFDVRDEIDPAGVLVVVVRGELDLDTVGELRRRLGIRFGDTAPAVIDLSECSFIDSTGLSLLMRTYRRAEEEGILGPVIVAAADGQVRRALRLTDLDSRLGVHRTREAAVLAVGQKPISPVRSLDNGQPHDGQPPSRPRVRR